MTPQRSQELNQVAEKIRDLQKEILALAREESGAFRTSQEAPRLLKHADSALTEAIEFTTWAGDVK